MGLKLPLTLKEEHRLRVFKNRVLRNTFGHERREVTGNDLYSSLNIMMMKSRRMRRAEHVAVMEENRNAYSVLVGKSDGKRQFTRHRGRWKENIKIHLQEI
jgi:hypothetical protein